MSWAGRVGVISAMASLAALTLPLLGNGCSAVTVPTMSPPSDAAAPEDSTHEVSVDSGAPTDAASLPPPADSTVTCLPGDVSTFAATWHPPVGPFLGACKDTQIALLIAACFDPKSTQATCDAWLSAPSNSTCEACWAGPYTAQEWAPFLYTDNPGQADYVNVSGCVALVDPQETQCAHVLECDVAACLANCPVPSGPENAAQTAAVNALFSCFQTAEAGGCKMLAQQASSCLPPDAGADAGPATFCYNAASDPGALGKYFSLVCGHGPSEAGADGG